MNRTAAGQAVGLRIYVDFDDVIAETARALAGLLRLWSGRRVAYDAIRNFDLRDSFSLDEAEYQSFMERAHAPEVLAELPETPGAAETLRGWLADGLEPLVVTGRPAACHQATRGWLDRHGLEELGVVYVDKYRRAPGSPSDARPTLPIEAVAGLGFRLAVEDAPTALAALERHGVGPCVVFDRPWNREYGAGQGGGTLRRVADWATLDRLVRHEMAGASPSARC